MIEVKITEDKEFPIDIQLNSGVHHFTKRAAEELYKKIGEILRKPTLSTQIKDIPDEHLKVLL